MRTSFILHADYIEDLPEEYKPIFLGYVYNYGIHAIEPCLSGLEQTVWIKIKRRIDEDLLNYDARIEGNSKGGKAHKGNQYTRRKAQLEAEQKQNEVVEAVKDVEEVTEVTEDTPKVSQAYSDAVFSVFKDNDLPCCNGNKTSFYMRDFANGLRQIHSNPALKGVHSDDIIQAVKNYVSVLKDDNCYISKIFSFASLVAYKDFTSFLPENFVRSNYVKYSNTYKAQEKNTTVSVFKPVVDTLESPKKCKFCGKPTVVKTSGGGCSTVACTECSAWSEYNTETKEWEWEKERRMFNLLKIGG